MQSDAATHNCTVNVHLITILEKLYKQNKSTFFALTQGVTDHINALGFSFESFTDMLKAAWDALCNLLAPVFEGVFHNIANIFSEISGAVLNSGSVGTVNNYYNNDNSRTVNQTNNSPKSLSQLEIYRMTRNALKA